MNIHAFPDCEGLAISVARIARVQFAPIAVHRFPDRETLVRVSRPVGRQAIVVRSLDDPNTKVVEVLLAADALRRAGARSVILVSPYLSYMRQDKVFQPGEPISQLVVGRLLSTGFDRVITLEPHLHRVRNLGQVFQCRAESLSAAPLIARWIKDRSWSGGVLVGPDQESERLVSEVANLAGLDFIVGLKHRLGDRSVKVRFKRSIRASGAVVVDDVASSGTTLIAVIQALHRMRVRVIDVVVAHPLFEPGALARLRAAGARRIVSCNSIRHSTNGIEIAPILAQALTGFEK